MPGRQVLLRQVGAAGDQAFFDVVIGNDFQQFIELRDTQALANVRLEQAILLAVGETVGTVELDVLDGKTTAVGRRRRLRRLDLFAGQLLEFFKTPALFFEQAILTLADQIGIPGSRRSVSKVHWRKA
ncbi:hypothetical protein D3C87_1270150 [compost metagenome]